MVFVDLMSVVNGGGAPVGGGTPIDGAAPNPGITSAGSAIGCLLNPVLVLMPLDVPFSLGFESMLLVFVVCFESSRSIVSVSLS